MTQVTAINAFSDNYIWCITNHASTNCSLVDPGDASVCIEFIKENNLTLRSILITHHHHDHVGGLPTLIDFAKQQGWPLTIYGPASENIKYLDVQLVEGDRVSLFDNNLNFSIIDLPGHTSGHIAYYGEDMLFCGDTLFSGGCGRLFEGTAKQMHNSLTKLVNLPDTTKAYCAHEYTLANLNFARTIEPNNGQLESYFNKVVTLREQEIATIPTTIGLEKQINPFLRSEQQEVINTAQQKSEQKLQSNVDVFAMIRTLKDNF
ncbi:hydroxyacylglutathione hydrolase [Thalassotalea nanhaiensis]|uniref:Hydroxyacylglutathione hydrolase n=1 Tax=Thalassotalea nanhaiensis TaxID=3065648 RepID=A0ABY9TGM5_9GAMM|nr:hydroxyacylglutathione hydrolase [Colwelliaceae bacterium SQ345]